MAINLSAPIDKALPVETVQGLRATITHMDTKGNLMGFIVFDDRKWAMSWTDQGTPIGNPDPQWAIRNVSAQAEQPVLIDITKPVRLKNDHANPVKLIDIFNHPNTDRIAGNAMIEGKGMVPMVWKLDGSPDGWSEAVGPIENVPEEAPPLIDITKPVKTADGRTVVNLISHGEILSGFIQNPDKPHVVSGPVYWNLDGSGVSLELNIRNVPEEAPEPTEREQQAALNEGFYGALEHRFGEDYVDKLYYDAIVAAEYGFVRNKEKSDGWEVWSMVDDFEILEQQLPHTIQREDVVFFYEWLRDRLEGEHDTAYDRGLVTGRKDAAVRIQTRYRAFLSAMSGDDAFANGSFPD